MTRTTMRAFVYGSATSLVLAMACAQAGNLDTSGTATDLGGSSSASGGTADPGNGGSVSTGGNASSDGQGGSGPGQGGDSVSRGGNGSATITATGGRTQSGSGSTTSGRGGSSIATGGASANGATSARGGAVNGGAVNGGASNSNAGAPATGGRSAPGGRPATGGSSPLTLGGSAAGSTTGSSHPGGWNSGSTVASGGSSVGLAGAVGLGGYIATGGAPASNATLRLDYEGCGDGACAPSDNVMKPYLKLTNTGSAPLSLTDISIRYYFTDEPSAVDTGVVYYSTGVTATDVTYAFGPVTPATAGADHYAQIGFKSGSIPAAGSVTVHSGLHTSAWDALNEANDYSYAGTSSFAPNDKLVLMQGTTIISGAAP